MGGKMIKVSQCLGTLSSVIALMALAPSAHADTRVSLDVSAGARAASNPYLVAGSSTGAVGSSLEVAPTITTGDGVSTLTVNGAGRYEHFFRRYGDDLSGRLGATFDRRFSEQTRFTLAGNFSTSMGGSRDLIRNDTGLGTGIDPVLNPNADVTVTGARFRQYTYGANARLNSRVSARGSLAIGGGASFFDAASALGQKYAQYSADAGYNHIIDDRKQIGVRVAYTNIDYRDRVAGGDVISPAVTGTFRLNATFTISGSVGATFASIKQLNGTRAHSTGVAAQVSFCKEMVQSQLCLSGARNVQATALGGVSTVTTVSAAYNWRLSERDSLNLSGSYGQTEQPNASIAQFGTNRTKLASAVAVYSRRLSEHLFLTVSPQFEKAWGQAIKRDANYGARVALRYRFGQ